MKNRINKRVKAFGAKNIKTKHIKRKFDESCGMCTWCGSSERLTVDHKTALSIGGENRLENLQILCLRCNNMKNKVLDMPLYNFSRWLIQFKFYD